MKSFHLTITTISISAASNYIFLWAYVCHFDGYSLCIHPALPSVPIRFSDMPWAFFVFVFLKFLWLCWVFVSVRGLSPVAASGGHSSSRCADLSLSRPLLLRSTGSRRAGSVVVAHGPSCFAACGIFPDQGSNPCPPHRQADSQPLRHQGSPPMSIFYESLLSLFFFIYRLIAVLFQLSIFK